MGHEQKAREQVEALGKFNVHISARFPPNEPDPVYGEILELDVKSWTPTSPIISVDLYDGTMLLINLMKCTTFLVGPQQKDKVILTSEDNN